MLFLVLIVVFTSMYLTLSLKIYKNLLATQKAAQSIQVVENGVAVLREHPDFRGAMNWAHDQGFEPRGMVDLFGPVGRLTMGFWKNPTTLCTLNYYEIPRLGQCTFEFGTSLGETELLCTANRDVANVYPHPPGFFVQSFHGADLESLREKHDQALAYLATHRGFLPVSKEVAMEVALRESMERQVEYIRSIPLWPLRGPYWYFVRRHRMNNRSIARQYPAGG